MPYDQQGKRVGTDNFCGVDAPRLPPPQTVTLSLAGHLPLLQIQSLIYSPQ